MCVCVRIHLSSTCVRVWCVGRRGADDSDANVSEGSPLYTSLARTHGGGQSAPPGYSRLSLSRLLLLSSIRENSGSTRSVCVYKSHCRRPHVCFGDSHFLSFSASPLSFKEDESSSRNRVLVGPVAISLYLKRRPTGGSPRGNGWPMANRERERKCFGDQRLRSPAPCTHGCPMHMLQILVSPQMKREYQGL